jgi:hypothetical protein
MEIVAHRRAPTGPRGIYTRATRAMIWRGAFFDPATSAGLFVATYSTYGTGTRPGASELLHHIHSLPRHQHHSAVACDTLPCQHQPQPRTGRLSGKGYYILACWLTQRRPVDYARGRYRFRAMLRPAGRFPGPRCVMHSNDVAATCMPGASSLPVMTDR